MMQLWICNDFLALKAGEMTCERASLRFAQKLCTLLLVALRADFGAFPKYMIISLENLRFSESEILLRTAMKRCVLKMFPYDANMNLQWFSALKASEMTCERASLQVRPEAVLEVFWRSFWVCEWTLGCLWSKWCEALSFVVLFWWFFGLILGVFLNTW